MSTPEYLDSGRDDGCIIGRSAGKIGLYETTPVAQAAAPAAAVTAGSTTTVANTALSEIQTALQNIGLMAT